MPSIGTDIWASNNFSANVLPLQGFLSIRHEAADTTAPSVIQEPLNQHRPVVVHEVGPEGLLGEVGGGDVCDGWHGDPGWFHGHSPLLSPTLCDVCSRGG